MANKPGKTMTGAVVAGAALAGGDAMVSDAHATIITTVQEIPFVVSLADFEPTATTSPGINIVEELLFEAVNPNPALGTLQDITIDVTSAYNVDQGPVQDWSARVMLFGTILVDATQPTAVTLSENLVSTGRFTASQFSDARFPLMLETMVTFDAIGPRDVFEWSGTVQLSYVFDDSVAVASPGSMTLLTAGVVSLTFGAGTFAHRRRRRVKASG